MTVTTRRERREEKLRKRRRAGGRETPSRDRSSTLITIAIVAIVLVGGVFLLRQVGAFEPPVAALDPSAGQVAQGEIVGTKIADSGREHVPDGQAVTYSTNPPTSGPHWATPAKWGISDTELRLESTTHNLEHGGIVILYQGLSPDDLSKLKTLVRQLTGSQFHKVVLAPYSKMSDAKIAVSAWDWQLKLAGFDETQIAKFVRSHYQGPDAPEPTAA